MGAPSTQRPCNSGQGDIRAHPPVEPARDQGHHGVSGDRSDGRGAGQRGVGPRRWRRAGREDRAVAQERIEDAGQAPGQRDDGNVFPAARDDAQGPGAECLGLGRPAAQDGDGA